MKKIILFDIDFTLSNRDYLKDFGRQYLARLVKSSMGAINPIVDRLIKESWEKFGFFDIYYYSKRVSTEFNDKDLRQKITDMFLLYYPYDRALYPEVKNVLGKLETKYILGIQSDGQEIFQLKKIESIMGCFDKRYIYIFRDKKVEIFKKIKEFLNNVIIIDDKPDYIEKLLKHGIMAIHMNRGYYARKNRGKYRIGESVETLDELINILL
jgi:FMN phosphatase YigB (HAD superfamily)